MDTTTSPVAVIRAPDGAILAVLPDGRVLRVERDGEVSELDASPEAQVRDTALPARLLCRSAD